MSFRFENLDVWNGAVNFAGDIYEILQKFPKLETFAISDQLRRAVVSISANIAEGSGSSSSKDFANYLSISLKSLHEVVSLLAVARKNGYINEASYTQLYGEAEILAKRIQALRNTL
jgi:four helix bundle protein